MPNIYRSTTKPFSTANMPSDRAQTLAAQFWQVGVLDTWQLGESRVAPDLTAIVQEIIDQPAWQAGNALALIVEDSGSAGSRRVVGFDRPTWYPGEDYAAYLAVGCESADPGSCGELWLK